MTITIDRSTTAPRAAHGTTPWWAVVAIAAVAINLRTPIAAVSALLDSISGGLHLASGVDTLLTSLPTLALGVFALSGPAVRSRVGDRGMIVAAVIALTIGNVLRMLPVTSTFLAGTVVVCAAIGIANVAIPSLIKQTLPEQFSTLTAVYTAVMTLGAAAAAALSTPLASLTGSAWVTPMAVVTVPISLLAVTVWLSPLNRRFSTDSGGTTPDDTPDTETTHRTAPAVLHDRTLWTLIAFFASTTLLAYSVLGWLPTMVSGVGVVTAGGTVLAASTFSQVFGSITSPLLRRIAPGPALVSCAAAALTGVSLVVILLAGSAVVVWAAAIVLGFAQGVAFSVALTLIGEKTRSASGAAQVSAIVQGVGYLLGVVGPLGVGVLHASSGGWTVPVALLFAVSVIQLVSAAVAERAPAIVTK